jgi:hypothetical protein
MDRPSQTKAPKNLESVISIDWRYRAILRGLILAYEACIAWEECGVERIIICGTTQTNCCLTYPSISHLTDPQS